MTALAYIKPYNPINSSSKVHRTDKTLSFIRNIQNRNDRKKKKKNELENIINLKLFHNFYVTTPPKSTNTETVIYETPVFPFTFRIFFSDVFIIMS